MSIPGLTATGLIKAVTNTPSATLLKHRYQANAQILANLFDAPVDDIHTWRLEYGYRFLVGQTGGAHTPLFTAINATPAYWQWFTHQCNQLDSSFIDLQADIFEQHDAGGQAATKVLRKAYAAYYNEQLRRGDFMAVAYCNFIKQYVKTLNTQAND